MEMLLLVFMGFFVLWLGTRILEKAGLNKVWVICLLIPILNVFMIWVFAFTYWPNLKPGIKQDL